MKMPAIDEHSLSEVLLKDSPLREVEPRIYSVIQDDDGADAFEKHAAFYDRVICNPIYNRLMWGYSVKSYDVLTRNALQSSGDGWVLDAGCGSLAFTARTYLQNTGRPVILLDRSMGLLRIAKARLIELNGEVPSNMVFLHGDALRLPFKPWIFTTVISLNLLHVLDDAKGALLEIKRVLIDEGSVTLTTLIENSRFADRYLRYLLMMTSGTEPRTAQELISVFDEVSMPVELDVKGSMAFIFHNI